MERRFDGRTVAITGATGIAAATANLLSSQGARVFVVSIDPDECRTLVEGIESAGGEAAFAAADLTSEIETVHAFTLASEFGALDGLVCVAGGSGRRFGDGPIESMGLEAWDATMALNLTTTMLPMREFIAGLVAGNRTGSIAVVTSVLATHPSPGRFATHAYAAAKGAQVSLIRAAAAAYVEQGIRVNGVAPAVVATPMSARAQSDETVARYVQQKQPLSNGFIDPVDVASAIAFLVSNDARTITGQVITVDGGWHLVEADQNQP